MYVHVSCREGKYHRLATIQGPSQCRRKRCTSYTSSQKNGISPWTKTIYNTSLSKTHTILTSLISTGGKGDEEKQSKITCCAWESEINQGAMVLYETCIHSFLFGTKVHTPCDHKYLRSTINLIVFLLLGLPINGVEAFSLKTRQYKDIYNQSHTYSRHSSPNEGYTQVSSSKSETTG